MSQQQDLSAKMMVLDVLSNPAITKMKYSFATRGINPKVYARVAMAILKGDITVMYSTALKAKGIGGLYCPVITQPDGSEIYDCLVLGWTHLPKDRDKMLNRAMVIIHECTHAAFDLLKLPLMNHAEHEMGAYIAGALYTVARQYNYWNNKDRRIPTRRPEEIKFATSIESAAWDIALRIHYDDRVPESMYTKLDEAIKQNTHYKKRAHIMAHNDGVGRAMKPAPKARASMSLRR